MNSNLLSWTSFAKITKEKIQNALNGQSEKDILVKKNPVEKGKCFHLRPGGAVPLDGSFCSLSEMVESLVQEGKQQESQIDNKKKIEEVLHQFFCEFRETIQKTLDSLTSRVMRELVKVFVPKNDVIELLENFQDGILNDDGIFLKKIEEILERMATQKSLWESDRVYMALNNCSAQLQGPLKKFKKSSEQIFKNIYKSCAFPSFPMLKRLEYVSGTFNNLQNKVIVRGHGVDINMYSDYYVSLSNGGHLVSRNIKNEEETLRFDIPNANNSWNTCKLSPYGNKIGITVRNPDQRVIFTNTSGQAEMQEIKTSHSANPSSSIWLDGDLFCVAFQDGILKIFSQIYGKCKKEIQLDMGHISALEINDKDSIFLMDSRNTVVLLNIFNEQVIWEKKGVHNSCVCPDKFGLKKSFDGTRLATTGDCDNLVKVMRTDTQENIWATNIQSRSWGVAWVPGDSYLLAIGLTQPYKVVALSSPTGEVLLEFSNNFDTFLHSIVVHVPTKHILVGDCKGKVHKIKLID